MKEASQTDENTVTKKEAGLMKEFFIN